LKQHPTSCKPCRDARKALMSPVVSSARR
jgi:hypothetical protein